MTKDTHSRNASEVHAERSSAGGYGLGKCRGGHYANQKADDGNSDQPIANFIHGALLHLVRSRGTPATYGHVGDALSWDGNKICDCHHDLGDYVFAQNVRELKSLARGKTPAGKIARSLKRTEGATRQKAFALGVSLDSRA
jgi:hypothetical protein